VAFHSRKFQPAEINYEIHDKQLLAIVDAFKHWRSYCEGATHHVQVFSDHQNLEYFTMTKVLNLRQVRWAQELAEIDFRIYYHPGTQNGKPNALSRHSEYRPEKGGVENQPITTVLRKNHFAEPNRRGRTFICSSARLASLSTKKWDEGFMEEIREKGRKDVAYEQAWKEVEAAVPEEQRMDRKARNELEIREELLYRKSVGNASRPLRRGAHTGATSTGATPTGATSTGATSSGVMAMARDPGHGDLAFLHSSILHVLSSLLLHTSIYLTISRIAFISLLLFRDLSLVLSLLTPLAPGLLLKTATAIRYLVTGYEPSAVTATKNLHKTSRVAPPNRSLVLASNVGSRRAKL